MAPSLFFSIRRIGLTGFLRKRAAVLFGLVWRVMVSSIISLNSSPRTPSAVS